MSLDNVKFRRPVVPGDQLRFELEMLQFRGKTCKMKGVAYVDGKVAAEAEMMAARGGPVTARASIRPRSWIPARSSATGVEVGPFAIIGPDVMVGDGCRIGPRATLERYVRLGAGVQRRRGLASSAATPQDLKFKDEETWVEIGAGHRHPRVRDDQPRHRRHRARRWSAPTAS